MKKLIGLGLLSLFIGFISVAASDSAQRQTKPDPSIKKGQAVCVSATIYGNLDFAFEGGPAWVGHILIKFGDEPAKLATFVDRNTSSGQRENGEIYGTETISVRLADGSGTFDISSHFVGKPQSTPCLYYLHETGRIENGTGRYALMSGSVKVHGPFLFPDPTLVTEPPPWIAEMHGVIFGLSAP